MNAGLATLFNFVYTFLANSEPELSPADCPDVTLPVKYFPKNTLGKYLKTGSMAHYNV